MHNASFPVCSLLHLSFNSALECSFTVRLVPGDTQYWCPDENVFLK